MSNVNDRRIFELDLGCPLEPDDLLSYYANGMLIPTDREKFLKNHVENGYKEPLKILANREKRAAEEITEILKMESEYKSETEEQKKGRWIKEKKQDAHDYHDLQKDLRAWDNDSDEPRPSTNWRELEMYGL